MQLGAWGSLGYWLKDLIERKGGSEARKAHLLVGYAVQREETKKGMFSLGGSPLMGGVPFGFPLHHQNIHKRPLAQMPSGHAKKRGILLWSLEFQGVPKT